MITPNIAQNEFIVNVIERDLYNISKTQLLIAEQNVYMSGKDGSTTRRRGGTINARSGAVLQALKSPSHHVDAGDTGLIVTSTIPLQMRFLDMKRHGNWKIYNRQVWGILYNNALPDIKYGYGQEISDFFRDELEQAFRYYSTSINGNTSSDYAKAQGRE